MEAKHALLFFLFQGTIYSWVLAADEDSTSHLGYFITRENKRLTGHLVKWFESPSLMSCSQSCLRNAWCSSTNFKVSSKKDGKKTCELNKHDNTLINENTQLNDQQGVTFSMLLKGCLMTGCANGGSCVFKAENQTYSCVCKKSWTGDNCEVAVYLTWYQVVVKTGTVDGAGTDANVYIRINGTTGYIEKEIDNEEDNREKGSEDTFIFQGKDYIGALRSVSIKRDNYGSSPDWYLETISVARSFSEEGFKEGLENAYGIQCYLNDWVDAHKWLQLKNE